MGPKSITVGFAITHPFWGNPYISHSWPISFDIAWRCPSGATTRAWPPRALSVPCGRMPSRSWRRSLTLGTPQILVIHYAWEPPTFWDIGVRSICDVYHICFLIMGCNGMYGSFLKWWYIIYVYINIYIYIPKSSIFMEVVPIFWPSVLGYPIYGNFHMGKQWE